VQGSVDILLWMFKGHAFVDVYGQIAPTIVNNVMDKLSPSLIYGQVNLL
jgi:hypothetical protein